jgi:phage/plasmid primase-like uncharacterized protein
MFDIKELNRQADLKELYERITGAKLRKHSSHWEGACPRCGGNDRFYIDPTKVPQLWTCTHCQGGKMHTALDLVSLCYGLPNSGKGIKDTADKLADLMNVSAGSVQYKAQYDEDKTLYPVHNTVQMVTTMPEIPPDDWQYSVKTAVQTAHDNLMSDAGKQAREYLLSRGFTEATLKRYLIGYNQEEYLLNAFDSNGKCIKALTGIYIPTFIKLNDDDDHTELLRVKVRIEDKRYKSWLQAYTAGRIKSKPSKYVSITGSKGTSLFCAEYTREYPDRIIYVEGEFDAMTVNQCAGDICHAVSFGSHSGIGMAEQWQSWYRIPENTIICFDNDDDPGTAETVRKDEERLRAEIIKAQSLDSIETRAIPPVIRRLPEQYHDWNDILRDHGAETVRKILTDFFDGLP